MWFYRTAAGEIGPVPGQDMVRLIEAGEITETTPVRRDGSDQWLEAWQTDRAGYLRTLSMSDGVSIDAGEVAGVWPRIGAYILDYIGSLICAVLVGLLVELVWRMATGPAESAQQEFLFGMVLGAVSVFLYYGIPSASQRQATFGMQALGLRMTRPNGHPISLIRGGIRPFMASISNAMLFLGMIVALFNRERITFHDWVCGTRVVKA